MTGLFSPSKPKLLHELSNDHLNKVLLTELTDHQTALTDKLLDQETFISESNGKIQYFNRYLNTAVFDSLVTSGTFLSLTPEFQMDLANLYSRIKHRNNLIDSKLRTFGYELTARKATTPIIQNVEIVTNGGGGTDSILSNKTLEGPSVPTTTTTTPTADAAVKPVARNVTEVKQNAGLEENIYNTKKEVMSYDKDILERVNDMVGFLQGKDEDDD